MAERSAGCTLKTEQRVNEEASYEKATVCIKQPLLFSIASANVGRFFESANILSKKEKKFCRNYFVAVIRNSE